MYLTHKTYIKEQMKMADLLFENPYLMLMMQHFGINFVVQDKSVEQVCKENHISKEIFIAIANLYNGFQDLDASRFAVSDIDCIIAFLKNSHHYYQEEKYPEIKNLIHDIVKVNNTPEIKLIERFFDEYFTEVIDHLKYEDEVAFPYFAALTKEGRNKQKADYSAGTYRDHHTDIETKIMELKKLLLKHIPLHHDRTLRRRLIISLFELEYDLTIHYTIEEDLLIPLIDHFEKTPDRG